MKRIREKQARSRTGQGAITRETIESRPSLHDQAKELCGIISGPEDLSTRKLEAWLKLSEESLTKAWGDPGDDVFNELLKK